MGTPFAMVSSAKAMVNLPKLSDLTINKSRSMRKSLGREKSTREVCVGGRFP